MASPLIWIILVSILVLAVLSLVPLFAHTSERTDDEHWRGFFYVNADDPALFVPKRYGIGYTLNFGNRWSWLVVALILLLVLAPLVVSLQIARHVPSVLASLEDKLRTFAAIVCGGNCQSDGA